MAFANTSVKLVEVCKVAPQPKPGAPEADPSPSPPHSLPLTFFDLLWLRFEPVQRLFFYEIPPLFDSKHLVSKLKNSLSVTLQQFLPLAGNITWPQDSSKPILSYVQGDAVSLTIADSNHADDFYHLSSSNDFVEAKEYHPLIPQLEVSRECAAAMTLQITIFPNRGFSIGTSMHHAILDGKTSTMFVKSWAHICKHESDSLPEKLKPFFDRRVIQDPAGLEPIYSNDLLNLHQPNNRSLMFTQIFNPPLADSVRGTFVLTRETIEALRQLVKQRNEEHQHDHQSVQYLSTFSLTCAYTWVCLVKAEEIKSEKALMGFTVDCRSRLNPRIPENYFGNCVAIRALVAETKALLGADAVAVAAHEISEAVKSLEAGVLNGAENWVRLFNSPVALTQERLLLSTAGSPRLGVYETDFGWGRPKKVEVVSIERTGAMSLSESRDGGGGVEVGLVMRKHHMEVFASLFSKGLGNL